MLDIITNYYKDSLQIKRDLTSKLDQKNKIFY